VSPWPPASGSEEALHLDALTVQEMHLVSANVV